MSLPSLGENPAAGTRISAGVLSVTFDDLPAGYSVRLLAGTQAGDDDIGSDLVTTPTAASVTVPVTAEVVHLTAWVTNVGNTEWSNFSWTYGVGAGSRSPLVVAHELEFAYLASKWKRSELSAYSLGITVADPDGHGHDEISPIAYTGQPFDVEVPAHTTPFTRAEVTGGNTTQGTGFLRCLVEPLRRPEVLTPGHRPEMRADVSLIVSIYTPAGSGPALSNLYTGVLGMIFTGVAFRPGEADIDLIRNEEPPDVRPAFLGEDGAWRYDRLVIPLRRYYRARPVGVQ